jgi:hypothetical protein
MVLGAVAAQADLTQSFDSTLTGGGWATPFSVPQFDTSLETWPESLGQAGALYR